MKNCITITKKGTSRGGINLARRLRRNLERFNILKRELSGDLEVEKGRERDEEKRREGRSWLLKRNKEVGEGKRTNRYE